MIRIRLTAADLAQVRLTPRPAPLVELNAALMAAFHPGHELTHGRWRRRTLRALPAAAGPLADLVPGGRPPAFLDVPSDSLAEGFATLRATGPALLRSELERVYATHPVPAPLWVRDLHRGDAGAFRLVGRAQRAAFEAVLGPVWPVLQDLHRAEFSRHAVTVAEHGVGAALVRLVPGSRLRPEGERDSGAGGHADAAGTGQIWEFAGPPGGRDIALRGRGLVLLPTFHWRDHPMLADLPGGPLYVTYPAGPWLPLTPDMAPGGEDALVAVLGRSRAEALRVLREGHTTRGLGRRLGLSDASASAHAAALRRAGLVSTVRVGRAVLHRRTALGDLLIGSPAGPL